MSKSRIFRFATLSMAIVIVAGLFASGWLLAASTNSRSQSRAYEVEVELVTLQPFGFEPAAIQRSKGKFVLLVDDRSGRESSSFQLQRDQGDRLKELKTHRKTSEQFMVVDLPPGKYFLTDVHNPTSTFQITIEP